MAMLEIKNLDFTYNGAKNKALSNINLEINEGEFILICGESGCGKTTLLKMLKRQLQPKGKIEGDILYQGEKLDNLDEKTCVKDFGFVMQNPNNQIVTDKVWHELAFGLESLGIDKSTIRKKVAEISSYFGINELYHSKTDKLSGGQKQLINLASIMIMEPNILLLDEPTSQLDPIASSEFLSIIKKINRDLGLTVILVEHRLEDVFNVADKIILMNKSKVINFDTPNNTVKYLNENKINMSLGLPSYVKIYSELENNIIRCPLSVRDCKKYLTKYSNKTNHIKIDSEIEKNNILEISSGYFRYTRNSKDILKNFDIKIKENEFLAIVGGNGAGKTTLLNILAGINRIYKGKFRLNGKKLKEFKGSSLYRNNISYLPQNPENLFLKNTVYEDLFELTKIINLKKEEGEKIVNDVIKLIELDKKLLDSHPYDLSGGEKQKVAFCKVLILQPKIILLDEPTKGLDAYSKKVFANILKKLKAEGKTIIMVSHDIEFIAKYADRCGMLFDGNITTIDNVNKFFSNSQFYTTKAHKISSKMFKNAITNDDVINLCQTNGKINEL